MRCVLSNLLFCRFWVKGLSCLSTSVVETTQWDLYGLWKKNIIHTVTTHMLAPLLSPVPFTRAGERGMKSKQSCTRLNVVASQDTLHFVSTSDIIRDYKLGWAGEREEKRRELERENGGRERGEKERNIVADIMTYSHINKITHNSEFLSGSWTNKTSESPKESRYFHQYLYVCDRKRLEKKGAVDFSRTALLPLQWHNWVSGPWVPEQLLRLE